jgi:hypothetical protein
MRVGESPPAAQGCIEPDAREVDPERGCLGKLLSPSRRRRCVDHVTVKLSVSERIACKALIQHRSIQRKKLQSRPDEEALTTDTIGPLQCKRAYSSNRPRVFDRSTQ